MCLQRIREMKAHDILDGLRKQAECSLYVTGVNAFDDTTEIRTTARASMQHTVKEILYDAEQLYGFTMSEELERSFVSAERALVFFLVREALSNFPERALQEVVDSLSTARRA